MKNLKTQKIDAVIEKYYKSEKLKKASREYKKEKRFKNYIKKQVNF